MVLRSDGQLTHETRITKNDDLVKENDSHSHHRDATVVTHTATESSNGLNGLDNTDSNTPSSRKREAESHSSLTLNGSTEGAEVKEEEGERSSKKQKLEEEGNHSNANISQACIAPQRSDANLRDADSKRKDIYLAEDWREQLCRCEQVSRFCITYAYCTIISVFS